MGRGRVGRDCWSVENGSDTPVLTDAGTDSGRSWGWGCGRKGSENGREVEVEGG